MSDRLIPVPDDHPEDAALAERLRDVLAERGRTTNGDVRAVLDAIPSLPDRAGATRRSWLAAAAAIALLVVGAAFVLGRISLPRVGGPSERVGREAFAGDSRLAGCEAQIGAAAVQVFEMTHAEWFPLYFPGWYRGAPELEVAEPALVVIGPSSPGMRRVPLPSGAPEPEATPSPSFPMCIAIGPPADASLHEYGPTWFDRIVPVLSDADIAHAAHLDPDVLADPTAWRYPERLAPCGGVTGTELYVFEARLNELGHNLPHLTDTFTDDDPVAVVIYRSSTAAETRHDVCLASELEGAQPDHVILRDVDITGLHVRIDRELTGPPILAPGPTPIPEPSGAADTPEPAPAWAGDVGQLLECLGDPADLGAEAAPRPDEVMSDRPDGVVRVVSARAWAFRLPIPLEGFTEVAADGPNHLFVHLTENRHTAAIAVVPWGGDPTTGQWYASSVASCGDAEFDPETATGSQPFGHWDDGTGSGTVDTTLLSATPDCYEGTQIRYDGRLYVRIPKGGVDPSQLETTWKADIALPSTAIDTGLRSGELRLYRSAKGGALYVARGDRAERLPHVVGDEVQRTDCN